MILEKLTKAVSDFYHKDQEVATILIWFNSNMYSCTVRRFDGKSFVNFGSGSGQTIEEAAKKLAQNWLNMISPGSSLIDLFNSL